MAGIYIHIPYCKQACHYCNFHFSTNTKSMQQMHEAMLLEIVRRKHELTHQKIDTIYFGGGTPGLLPQNMIIDFIECIQLNYQAQEVQEITIEVNPDDMTSEKLLAYRNAGVNRLSIGTQSFFEEDLLYMNRSHDAQAAKRCIQLARELGFKNLSIDLIYGFPLLSNEKWKHNFFEAIEQGITHISCYAMTVEPKTALNKMIQQQKVAQINNAQSAFQFELLMNWVEEIGWDHYEISNFASPNNRAMHNSNYWHGANYLGIGPSAHSFDGSRRCWNIANNAMYINGINNNLPIAEKEVLTAKQQLNEYIMTNIRLKEGIHLPSIKNKCSDAEWQLFLKEINAASNLFEKNNDFLFLNNQGKLFADKIASDLFFV
jgi:oxygen-independent coproporphyrinogen-3 oxidase